MKKLIEKLSAFAFVVGAMLVVTSCGDDEPTVDAPDARFTFSASGLTVTFTDASVGAETYAWDFGDGGSSADASPSYTYSEGGSYTVTLTVSNDGGQDTAEETIVVEAPFDPAVVAGTWVMAPEEGALAVGPAIASGEWWQNSGDDVTARACYFDDTYTFAADGTFTLDMGDETWVEAWQEGVDADGCGAPVTPYVGGEYTWSATASAVTVTGSGAFLGLAKVTNDGEVSGGAAVAESVTYTILESDFTSSPKSMTVYVEFATGSFWTFKLVTTN